MTENLQDVSDYIRNAVGLRFPTDDLIKRVGLPKDFVEWFADNHIPLRYSVDFTSEGFKLDLQFDHPDQYLLFKLRWW